MKRAFLPVLVGLGLIAALACEVNDPNLVVRIGISTLVVLDPTLAVQVVDPSLEDEDAPIQVAHWKVESATLFIQDSAADLLDMDTCSYTDAAAAFSPVAEGGCSEGIVLEATTQPVQVSLRVKLRPTLARAEPVPWVPGGDFDGDGVSDTSDNCPLLANPGQEDAIEDGIGDACSRFDSAIGQQSPDNDGDGVVDRLDNCVWIANPLQANTTGLGTDAGVFDGIGDACTEQQTEISDGAVEFDLGPIPFQQPLAGGTFLVVDFKSRQSLDLDACVWSAGTPGFCPFDPSAVRFCTSTSVNILLTGCP